MKKWKKRGAVIAGALLALGTASAFLLNALDSNIALYVTPSEVAQGKVPAHGAFRIGGMVKAGSLQRENLTVRFVVTDLARDVPVAYTGILPDLFQEGKGTVVQGRLDPSGAFVATEVLAKHDENYMPPAAQHSLDQARAQAVPGTAR